MLFRKLAPPNGRGCRVFLGAWGSSYIEAYIICTPWTKSYRRKWGRCQTINILYRRPYCSARRFMKCSILLLVEAISKRVCFPTEVSSQWHSSGITALQDYSFPFRIFCSCFVFPLSLLYLPLSVSLSCPSYHFISLSLCLLQSLSVRRLAWLLYS